LTSAEPALECGYSDAPERISKQNVEIVTRCWEVFLEAVEQGDPGVLFDQGLYAPACTITVPELVGTKPYVWHRPSLIVMVLALSASYDNTVPTT
jgi:hypothetical protein